MSGDLTGLCLYMIGLNLGSITWFKVNILMIFKKVLFDDFDLMLLSMLKPHTFSDQTYLILGRF